MAIDVTPGLARKNEALMKEHLKTLKRDQEKREASGNAEIAAASKEAGRWVYERGRGKKYLIV